MKKPANLNKGKRDMHDKKNYEVELYSLSVFNFLSKLASMPELKLIHKSCPPDSQSDRKSGPQKRLPT
jgi:hypothetical protein